MRQRQNNWQLRATATENQVVINIIIKDRRVKALLDSGASGNFMNPVTVQQLGLLTKKKEVSKDVKGLDGELLGDTITEETGWVSMTIGDHRERINFDIIRLGNVDIVLGMPWFVKHNPEV